MKYVASFAALALLGGCSDNGAVTDAVKAGLKDPDSAEFGAIDIREGPGGKWACVTVNARNSFGGYTGDQQVKLKHTAGEGWQWVGEPAEISHASCVDYTDFKAKGEGE